MQIILVPGKLEKALDALDGLYRNSPVSPSVVVSYPHPDQIAETAAYVAAKACGKAPQTFIYENADIDNDVVARHISRSIESGEGTLVVTNVISKIPGNITSSCSVLDASYCAG